jgi:hypothetical protein
LKTPKLWATVNGVPEAGSKTSHITSHSTVERIDIATSPIPVPMPGAMPSGMLIVTPLIAWAAHPNSRPRRPKGNWLADFVMTVCPVAVLCGCWRDGRGFELGATGRSRRRGLGGWSHPTARFDHRISRAAG